MRRGGRVAVVALLLCGVAAGARAQAPPGGPPGEPDDPYGSPQAPTTGAEGLSAPTPSTQSPTPEVAPPPSYARYGSGGGVPPVAGPQAYDTEIARPEEPEPEVDEGRRRGTEMIELYITSSFYTAFGTAYLLSLGDPMTEEESSYVILGALLGPATVVAVDLATGGLPTGVPPAVAMGLLGGAIQAGLLSNAFEDLVTTDAGVFGLITASMTIGGALGGVVGTQLRPSVADVRLVASTAAWGLYFTAMASLAVDAAGDDMATAMLVGFDAGAALGLLLTPLNDLTSGQVMLLSAGVGAGGLLGFMVSGVISGGHLDGQASAASMGVGSLAGLLVTYLLVRPDDSDAPPREESARDRSLPFVAPTADGRGAIVGLGGVL